MQAAEAAREDSPVLWAACNSAPTTAAVDTAAADTAVEVDTEVVAVVAVAAVTFARRCALRTRWPLRRTRGGFSRRSRRQEAVGMVVVIIIGLTVVVVAIRMRRRVIQMSICRGRC